MRRMFTALAALWLMGAATACNDESNDQGSQSSSEQASDSSDDSTAQVEVEEQGEKLEVKAGGETVTATGEKGKADTTIETSEGEVVEVDEDDEGVTIETKEGTFRFDKGGGLPGVDEKE